MQLGIALFLGSVTVYLRLPCDFGNFRERWFSRYFPVDNPFVFRKLSKEMGSSWEPQEGGTCFINAKGWPYLGAARTSLGSHGARGENRFPAEKGGSSANLGGLGPQSPPSYLFYLFSRRRSRGLSDIPGVLPFSRQASSREVAVSSVKRFPTRLAGTRAMPNALAGDTWASSMRAGRSSLTRWRSGDFWEVFRFLGVVSLERPRK